MMTPMRCLVAVALAALCPGAGAGETCATATPVGLGTTLITAGTTTDNNPGASCNATSVQDVFFTFTPITSGRYTIDTCGSSVTQFFDTVLSVYAGPCGATTQIACNDDNDDLACGPHGWSSRVSGVCLSAGTAYLIRVAAYDEFSTGDGNGHLTISFDGPCAAAPANDLCANAADVSVGTTLFDTTGAGTEGPLAPCGFVGSGGFHDVFFRFTAPATSLFQFDTCGTQPGGLEDTILQVLSACTGNSLACNDDGCGTTGLGSSATVPLSIGQQVWVRVSSWDVSSVGAGVLTILPVNQPLGVVGGTSTEQEVTQVYLRAFVSPGSPPVSTGVSVTADLSSLGGSAAQAFSDSGPPLDEVAGDFVYEFRSTLPPLVETGVYSYPVVVTDAQGRSGSGVGHITVTDGPSGACCASDGSCSITRETLCTNFGGMWQGAGASCGGAGYMVDTAGAGHAFVPIAGTGTLLATVSDCDDCSETIAVPFSFNFFGLPVSTMTVSSNGNIQFDTVAPSEAFANTPLPSPAAPRNTIFPAWDDYDPSAAGGVYVQVFGNAPARVCKVSWEGLTEFGADPANSNNFQVTFIEGSDSFFIQYGLMDNLPEVLAGDVTIGVVNADGTGVRQQPTSSAGDASEFEWVAIATPPPCGTSCDSVDFNQDTLFPDTADIDDFLSVFSGGPCSTDPSPGCNDVDFNNDTLFPDTLDIDALLSVFSGGPCLI